VSKRRKRVWVQQVAVAALALETRLQIAEARGLTKDQKAAAAGVREFLARAKNAAHRIDPIPSRWANWWRGTLVDTAYQNLHAARAQMIDVYDEAELTAEIPRALARSQAGLHREDPRQVDGPTLLSLPLASRRAVLQRSIEDGYDASDRQHERLRSFRNIILLSAVLIALLVAITIYAVWANPQWMPLCFPADQPPDTLNCPTGSGVTEPQSMDIVVVALMGLLGGSLAATVSIRNLRGTSTPYDVPVALAMLKVPLGAFTAIVGLVAIRGEFVPGLTALDSQEQILAYALILGFGQQVFTRTLDKKAQNLLEALPSKDATMKPVPPPAAPSTPPPPPPPPGESEGAAGPAADTGAAPELAAGTAPPDSLEPPLIAPPGSTGEPIDVLRHGDANGPSDAEIDGDTELADEAEEIARAEEELEAPPDDLPSDGPSTEERADNP